MRTMCWNEFPNYYVTSLTVTNYDYFIAGGFEATSSSYVAYAGNCATWPYDGRPMYGRTKINLNNWSTGPSYYRRRIYTMIHEVMHALGFSSYYF